MWSWVTSATPWNCAFKFAERKLDNQQKGPSTGLWGTPEASRNGYEVKVLIRLNMLNNENQAGAACSRILDPLAGKWFTFENVVKYVSRVV